MSSQPLDKNLDPSPLVAAILEKSKAGRLKWEATADENVFIASVGGNTLKIYLGTTEGFDEYTGQMEQVNVPVLRLLDDKGRTLWEIWPRQVKGGFQPLFDLARRVGNKLDERMESLIGALEKL